MASVALQPSIVSVGGAEKGSFADYGIPLKVELQQDQYSFRRKFIPPRSEFFGGSNAAIRRAHTMSALPPKADIRSALADVRYGPIADIQ
jgi:hypothetical protein